MQIHSYSHLFSSIVQFNLINFEEKFVLLMLITSQKYPHLPSLSLFFFKYVFKLTLQSSNCGRNKQRDDRWNNEKEKAPVCERNLLLMQLNRNYHLSCVYGVPWVKKGNIIFILECKSSGGESLTDFLVHMLCSSLRFDITSRKTAVFLQTKEMCNYN